MIKFENTEVQGWEHAIRGMRNPMNSWERSDSKWSYVYPENVDEYILVDHFGDSEFWVGPNDQDLMARLAKGGPVHAKYRRMIAVYVDITAPLYWWKEFDTYKVGTVANSCSTMHKIAAKEFTLEDFSCEHLMTYDDIENELKNGANYEDLCCITNEEGWGSDYPDDILYFTIAMLNKARELYIKATEKLKRNDLTIAERKYITAQQKLFWWQMIQLLPSSYNQRRTVMLNYEVLANIYKSRKDHKLDEWCEHKEVMPNIDSSSQAKYAKPYKEYFGFCDWIKTLPYSELITGNEQKVYDLGKNMLEGFLEGVKRTASDNKGE